MTETVLTTAGVKRRQYLLLAGVGGAIVAGTLFSVSLTGSRPDTESRPKPKSTNILSPGAQVDPRDAWRGQADAQLRAIEQKSRELSQRDTEMQGQSREMVERLRKLEGGGAAGSASSGLTALPPPPVAAPATRPSFGPDAVNGAQVGSGSQRPGTLPQLPPPPPPLPNRAGGFAQMPGAGSNGGLTGTPSGIVSITLADPTPAPTTKAGPATDPAVNCRTPRHPALHPERYLHPRAAARRPGRPHRRAGPAQPATRAAAPDGQRGAAQSVPLQGEGVFCGGGGVW